MNNVTQSYKYVILNRSKHSTFTVQTLISGNRFLIAVSFGQSPCFYGGYFLNGQGFQEIAGNLPVWVKSAFIEMKKSIYLL